MSRFAETIQAKSISPEQILRWSVRNEQHRAEDRAMRLRREELRRAGKPNGYAEAGIAKPRSGRPLSRWLVEAALAGRPLTPRVRTKLRRAITALAGEVSFEQLFGDVGTRRAQEAPAPHGEAAPAPLE